MTGVARKKPQVRLTDVNGEQGHDLEWTNVIIRKWNDPFSDRYFRRRSEKTWSVRRMAGYIPVRQASPGSSPLWPFGLDQV